MKDTLLGDGEEDTVSVDTPPVHQKRVNASESPRGTVIRGTVILKGRNDD